MSRHRARATPLLAALAAAALAAPVTASAAFSLPQRLATTGDVIGVKTSVDADGTQRIGWLAERSSRVFVATRAPNAATFASRAIATLSSADSFAELGFAGNGAPTLAALRGEITSGAIVAATGQANGSLGPATSISGDPGQVSVPVLAENAAGDAVVAWSRHESDGWHAVTAVRPAGAGTFGPPAVVAGAAASDQSGGGFAPTVAISPGGHVVLGFEAEGRVYGVTGSVATGLGAPQPIGRFRPNYGPLSVAAGDTRSVLAWTDIHYVSSRGRGTAYKASLAGADGRFAAASVVGTTPGEQPAEVGAAAAAVTTRGTALLAVAPGERMAVFSAPPSGGFGSLNVIARTHGSYSVSPALATGPDGAALLTWTREYPSKTVKLAVQSVVRDATGRWGHTAQLSSPREEALDPVPALGAGGRAVIGWVQSPQGFGNGNVQVSASACC